MTMKKGDVFAMPRCPTSTMSTRWRDTRNAADAEDAVQECYLRALRHFDTFRGPAIKPWLFAILRNICRFEFVHRSRAALAMDDGTEDDENAVPLWQEQPVSPELEILRQRDGNTIRRLVEELPEPFREAIVLREMNELSYREIADVVGTQRNNVWRVEVDNVGLTPWGLR